VSETSSAAMRRAVAVVPGALGVALLARPQQVGEAVSDRSGRPADWIVRLLGARMALQAVVTLARPTTAVGALGTSADLSHAASMVWAARRLPRYRRAALTSAAVATVCGAADLAVTIVGRRKR
jgi:uncharacterized membrane protein YadS